MHTSLPIKGKLRNYYHLTHRDLTIFEIKIIKITFYLSTRLANISQQNPKIKDAFFRCTYESCTLAFSI